MSYFFASGGQSIGFSFSLSPSNEYSWLISFRIDWVDLLCSPRDSQESSPTPQFKSTNSCSSFSIVQCSYPYMTTGKTIALTRQTFVSKGKSLLFNLLSRLEKGMANHFSNLALITPVPSIEISSVQSLSGVRLFLTS